MHPTSSQDIRCLVSRQRLNHASEKHQNSSLEDSKMDEDLLSSTDISFDSKTNAILNWSDSLCGDCCQIPWHCLDRKFSWDNNWEDATCEFNHCQSFGELDKSSQTGCRICQIIWLNIVIRWPDIKDKGRLRFAFNTSPPGSGNEACILVHAKFYQQSTAIRVVKTVEENYQDFQEKSLKATKRLMPENLRLKVDELVHNIVLPWINTCRHEHPECQQNREESSQLPTRLIDVGIADKDQVKLIDTRTQVENSNKMDYLILSYCWGEGNEVAKTTLSNLEQRKRNIAIAHLPKTIRDAIALTQAMGVRYLWVDAMCIVQPGDQAGDQKDWYHESTKMGQYYSNALCCISASSAADSMEGFLTGRRLMQFSWQPYTLFHSNREYSIMPPELHIGDEIKNAPLMTRGWYLQEFLLSTRILHWTRVGLVCDCRRDILYEYQSKTSGYRNYLRRLFEASRENPFHAKWPRLITHYSGMNLTFSEDRLAAIHSVAKSLALKHHKEYFAGIFVSYLAEGLWWRQRDHRGDGMKTGRFPSWSWASTHSIQYTPHDTIGTSLIHFDASQKFPSIDEMTDFNTLTSRILRVDAPVLRLDKAIVATRRGSHWQIVDQGDSSRSIHLYDIILDDNPNYFPELSSITFLILMRCEENRERRHKIQYNCLVLRKLEVNGEDMYERIGVMKTLPRHITETSITDIENRRAKISLV